MKRFKIDYTKICDIENVRLAIRKASKGKTRQRFVQRVLANIEYYALEVQKMLINKSYIPSPYIEKIIYEGSSHKERIIHKPKFYPDQIIHHCLMNVIEPYLAKRMYYYSCASVKGKGIHFGVKYVKKIYSKNPNWKIKYCLKMDIKKFYPSIDKEILKSKFRRAFKGNDTLWLIDTIIDSHNKGLPIGNYTSQWFSNFYLTDLDMFVLHKLKPRYYIRYADDMVLLGSNKKKLHTYLIEIKNYLENIDNVKLKNNYQVFRTIKRPLDFLGYKYYPINFNQNKRVITTIRGSIFLRIIRRLKTILNSGRVTLKQASCVISYYGWYIHSNFTNVYNKYVRNKFNFKYLKEIIRNENLYRYKTNFSI